MASSPLDLLAAWAAEAGPPWTMTLATAGAAGRPHARTVLVTEIDAESLRFHSSTPTTKTQDIAARPWVSGVFHWPALGRQVVLTGTAGELDAAVSRAAFPTRPLGLRRLAWVYEKLGAGAAPAPGEAQRAFAGAGEALEMPPSWTTVRVVPVRLDFWEAGTDDTAATKTRYDLLNGTWSSRPALP